jgi:fatty acid desaturase
MAFGCLFERYKHIFGKERQGAHALRIPFLNVALVDVVATIVGAFLIAYFTKWSFLWTLLGLFLLGIVLHRLFCVKTTVDVFLTKLFE